VIEPQLHLHSHFEFDNSFNNMRCCWWCCWCPRPKQKVPKEYHVNKDYHLERWSNSKGGDIARVIANRRLADILQKKFKDEPVKNEVAFALLKMKLEDNFANGNPITNEKLGKIIRAIAAVRLDISMDVKQTIAKSEGWKLPTEPLQISPAKGNILAFIEEVSETSEAEKEEESPIDEEPPTPPKRDHEVPYGETAQKAKEDALQTLAAARKDTTLPFTSGWT